MGMSIAPTHEIVNWISIKPNRDRYIRILDTTLRDGEQMPGIDLKPEYKLKVALALEDLGVDSIEAGFPITSRGEFEAVKMIAREISSSEVIALARANKTDIDRVIEADADAVHTFIATSDIHIKYKLRMTREQVIERAVEAVEYAKSHGLIVEFSAEDATRSDREFLVRVFQAVVDAGADRIDIADTVGVAYPIFMFDLVSYIKRNVRGNYILSVHCHDDFGMSVANSITAVEAGADQVHATILGVGERAGNASLEEVSTALAFLLGYRVGIKFQKIYSVAKLVAEYFGIEIPLNKAIVGRNAFAHESGIHVHGVISNPLTYEPIDPSLIGVERKIVLGKHSGRHAVIYVLKSLGIEPRDEIVDKVLAIVKDLGDQGIKIDTDKIIEIIRSVVGGGNVSLQNSGNRG
ncbi:2-isopropylmalate synthase [Ignisphaera aggregans DSM 17230]|uniref:2-isopropylmalate synthase n=1 Tax=Ignisphaera aggregans (strain DSM 17230 / JCM 13409 / AQ1.S1) TaxID=583356 RepID=E0SRB3_IGNAA|nr:2-isopropylmalate synthase [Ignisphaera aggregans DSM 17230]